MASIKVKFASDYEMEVEADHIGEVILLANETTKKFFPNTKWLNYEISQ